MDLDTLIGFSKLIGDGIVMTILIVLYIYDRNKRNKEYKEERDERNKEYKIEKETLDKEREEYKNNYNNLVKEIIDGVNCHYLTPEESKSIAQIEKQINDVIQNILIDTNASRVSVVKYHNGNKDMTGMSFLKMSMTNEVVNKGVAPLMGEFKDLFRSYLAYWCHEIEINEKCIINDVFNFEETDITLYEYLKSHNIQARYGIALKDINNEIIGFLCVEYLDKKNFDLNRIEKTLNNNYRKIETLMTLNKMEGDNNGL